MNNSQNELSVLTSSLTQLTALSERISQKNIFTIPGTFVFIFIFVLTYYARIKVYIQFDVVLVAGIIALVFCTLNQFGKTKCEEGESKILCVIKRSIVSVGHALLVWWAIGGAINKLQSLAVFEENAENETYTNFDEPMTASTYIDLKGMFAPIVAEMEPWWLPISVKRERLQNQSWIDSIGSNLVKITNNNEELDANNKQLLAREDSLLMEISINQKEHLGALLELKLEHQNTIKRNMNFQKKYNSRISEIESRERRLLAANDSLLNNYLIWYDSLNSRLDRALTKLALADRRDELKRNECLSYFVKFPHHGKVTTFSEEVKELVVEDLYSWNNKDSVFREYEFKPLTKAGKEFFELMWDSDKSFRRKNTTEREKIYHFMNIYFAHNNSYEFGLEMKKKKKKVVLKMTSKDDIGIYRQQSFLD